MSGIKEWLKSLKVGDEVAIRYRGTIANGWVVTSIEKITPTGRLNLSDGRKAHPSGELIGDPLRHIQPLTDSIIEEIVRERLQRNIVKSIKKIDYTNADVDKLTEIDKLVTEICKETNWEES